MTLLSRNGVCPRVSVEATRFLTSARLLRAGPDDAVLVRVHHRLDAVTQAQLEEQAGDVGLHRQGLDDEQLSDLRVAEAAREQLQHLLLADGEPGCPVRQRARRRVLLDQMP